MKNFALTYLVLAVAILFSFGESIEAGKGIDVKLESNKLSSYQVGQEVVLTFSSEGDADLALFYSNSYGSSLLSSTKNGNTVSFKFPKFVSDKIGTIVWKLINQDKIIEQGQIQMKPSKQVVGIETYLGPIFMQAGQSEYGHLVSIPTDSMDNPVETNTEVLVNQQFYSSNVSSSVFTSHLMSFEIIPTKTQSGRISINAISEQISSKELTTEVNATNPEDYEIKAKTNHPYADGNQLATLSTSVIKDKYGNVVVDGTFVKFLIVNKNNSQLFANGTTINGVATAKINHPNEADTWKVSSYIHGMAKSSEIQVQFLAAIKEYEVSFSDSNKNIKIGPIKSYMNQLIPDGLNVQLRVIKGGEIIYKTAQPTSDGIVNFVLKSSSINKGSYEIEVELAGITKSYKNIDL